MTHNDSYTLSCHTSRETENAILLELDDGTEAWVPFSQVEHIVRDAQGTGISITISKWIAQKKGMI